MLKTLEFRDGALWLLDQTRLPLEETLLECRDYRQVAEAIRMLRVRGAPAIGVAAGYGVALAARALAAAELTGERFFAALGEAIEALRGTRPTAVNLFMATDRLRQVIVDHPGAAPALLADLLLEAAHRLRDDDEAANRALGQHGAALLPDGANVLTHCNTGALAATSYGTALGVIRAAREAGKRLHVWVDETRPLLQGARLTTWELRQLGIPHTLIADNMAAHFMARGRVDMVLVGADRIAANGDTANKIGTYGLAVLARAHDLPFYVAAPTSTLDLTISSGDQIVIEERRAEEVTAFGGVQVAPEGTAVANPAFDVTPVRLITAIITDRGIARPPYTDELAATAPPRANVLASIQQLR